MIIGWTRGIVLAISNFGCANLINVLYFADSLSELKQTFNHKQMALDEFEFEFQLVK